MKWPPPAGLASRGGAAVPGSGARTGHGHGHGAPSGESSAFGRWGLLVAGLALLAVGYAAPASFITHFTVFVLACFIGYQVIWSVTPALHTPLMSVTNAISGILVIGGMLQVKGSSAASLVGLAAVVLATINIAGGFLVTQRMLRMFHR
jgi:NAD(P) transhydrogenase subunit alpha